MLERHKDVFVLLANNVAEKQKLFADKDDITAKSFFIIGMDMSRRSGIMACADEVPHLTRCGARSLRSKYVSGSLCGSHRPHVTSLKHPCGNRGLTPCQRFSLAQLIDQYRGGDSGVEALRPALHGKAVEEALGCDLIGGAVRLVADHYNAAFRQFRKSLLAVKVSADEAEALLS